MNHHSILFLVLACFISLLFHIGPLSGDSSHFCDESCAFSTLHGHHKKFRIYLLTFNVNEKDVSAILEDILFDASVKPLPDMYAIVLQEFPKKYHLKKLQDIMKKHKYYPIGNAKKLFLQVAVYAADEHKQRLSEAEFQSLDLPSTATFQRIHKSSIAIRFTFHDADHDIRHTFCIIGAHFDSDEGKKNQRIQNFQKIMKKIRFKTYKPEEIMDYNHVLFMGDLNFRLLGNINRDEILNLISKKEWPDLLKHDELKKAQIGFTNADKTVSKAFEDFKEADIDFAPTYKFVLDATTKEQMPDYDKKRTPAYTDRILARFSFLSIKSDDHEKSFKNFDLSSYHAIEPSDHLKIYSDHRPVRAIYEVPLWAVERLVNRNKHYANRPSRSLNRPSAQP